MTPAGLAVGPTRWERSTDVIVVGSGAAGLSAALGLSDAGRRVTLLTKGALGDGSTAWAQGGLAAVIDPKDALAGHVRDTLLAGAGLSQEAAVAELVAGAPGAIRRLSALGARFDRGPDGGLALGLEGGHRARRIVHAGGDASGAEVARVLADAVRRAVAAHAAGSRSERGAIEVLEGALAVDALLSADGAASGLRVLAADGTVGELRAGAVILATGGIGQAWPVTTNPPTATGDGLALALRAGAVVCDVEFVQFHPTVLVAPGERGALISEALRGEGARLTDTSGAPIMAGVHPLGDLAPRDVVAAAIHRRMADTGTDHVLLDGSGFSAMAWREHFPTILGLCLERGVDPRAAPIPVAPAAHYSCGGVLATLDGVTSVPGLYAIGEVASTGVQGANRLASNSLTEALIAGSRVAELVARGPLQSETPIERNAVALPDPGIRSSLVTAMGRGCGVLRDETGLGAALDTLAELAAGDPESPEPMRGPAAGFGAAGFGPAELRSAVEAANLHAVASAVASAALQRTESRGAHRRADFPEPRAEWHRHQHLRLLDGEIRPLEIETELETGAVA